MDSPALAQQQHASITHWLLQQAPLVCRCVLQVHWTATVHFAVLIATTALVVSLLPFLYFSLHLWWQSKTAHKASGHLTPSQDTRIPSDTSEPAAEAGGDDIVHMQCSVINIRLA